MLMGNLVTEPWSGPKVDSKLNIGNSTYSCGVALSSKEVIFEIYRNHSRRRKVARLGVASRDDPTCKATSLMAFGFQNMDRSRMWVNLCINHSQFTQSTSAKFKVEFDDLTPVVCHWGQLPPRSPVLGRDRDTNFWSLLATKHLGALFVYLSLPHQVLSLLLRGFG